MSEYQPVLRTPELGPGQSRVVEAHGTPVVILNRGQTYYALEGLCPQSGGTLEPSAPGAPDRLVCPDDHAEYEVPSGRRVGGAGRPLRRYAVRVEENAIKVGPPL